MRRAECCRVLVDSEFVQLNLYLNSVHKELRLLLKTFFTAAPWLWRRDRAFCWTALCHFTPEHHKRLHSNSSWETKWNSKLWKFYFVSLQCKWSVTVVSEGSSASAGSYSLIKRFLCRTGLFPDTYSNNLSLGAKNILNTLNGRAACWRSAITHQGLLHSQLSFCWLQRSHSVLKIQSRLF